MPYPQLTGRTTPANKPTSGHAIVVAVLGLAALLAVVGWRLLPHQAPAPISPQHEATKPTTVPAPQPSPDPGLTEDERLRLEHAEQELITAAEQLTTARRLLARLSPDLNREYLQFEKRRADSAWTSCNVAARAIERAHDDIKVITTTEKD